MPSAINGEKLCPKCGVTLPANTENFYKSQNASDGLMGYCKSCAKAHAKKHAKENFGWMRQKYGISASDYYEMLDLQNGGCAICKTPPRDGRRLDIDHCHDTGVIRGLLCNRCNQALGLLSSDVSRLVTAIEYLSKDGGYVVPNKMSDGGEAAAA